MEIIIREHPETGWFFPEFWENGTDCTPTEFRGIKVDLSEAKRRAEAWFTDDEPLKWQKPDGDADRDVVSVAYC